MERKTAGGELREFLDGLKHGSYTIEAEVAGRFDEARNMEEFKKNSIAFLKELIEEARERISEIKGLSE